MANGWTPQRRRRQSRQIRSWRPSETSTGPRTEDGKARSARNAWKGGWRGQLRAVRIALKEHDVVLEKVGSELRGLSAELIAAVADVD